MIKENNLNKIYVKTCKKCNRTFESDKPKVYICPNCKRKRVNEYSRRINKTAFKIYERNEYNKDVPLWEIVNAIDRYNKKNHKDFSYGKTMVLLTFGELELIKKGSGKYELQDIQR